MEREAAERVLTASRFMVEISCDLSNVLLINVVLSTQVDGELVILEFRRKNCSIEDLGLARCKFT